MMDDDTELEQSERAAEVERAFLDVLSRSGLSLETLDAVSATQAVLAFYRDVKFGFVAPPDEGDPTDELSVEIEPEHAPGKEVNPLLALFVKPAPGPLDALILAFERNLTATDDEDVFFYLELRYAPDGLEDLEALSLYADDFDSLEDFARELLAQPAMQALAATQPEGRSLDVL